MELPNSAVAMFQVWDYVVFACLFLVSSGIGVFFAIKERKKVSSNEFLVGGRQLTCGPVALSLTASFMSAVTVIGTPSEVYRFGATFIIFAIAYTLMVILTAELYLPVFYRSGITSTYEYLELRFSKVVRRATTVIYTVQTILYTGVVVYAPALALNQVTGFNLWGSIFATGIVCTFYCTLMVVMVAGFLTVLVQGTHKSGGMSVVWETAQAGQRLNVFDFDLSPLRRHTFWTVSVGGMFTWLGIYGVNQSTIQRCISCKTETHARCALYLNLLGLLLILFCGVVSGLIMYTFYSHCDPWTAGFVSAPDQLMPYFVLEVLGNFPGLPGLYVACAFSGTLSTVAASINALATVTYEDFVSQCFRNLSNRAAMWISKGLCVMFGVICTSMAVAASNMGAVLQAALSIHGMCGGPTLGLFSLGILFPFTNTMGAIGGLILGISLSFWVGLGAFIHPASHNSTRPLPLSTESCYLLNITVTAVTQTASSDTGSVLAESWYSMSYLYYSAVGFLATVIGGLLITLITGPNKPQEVKPGLIRPVCDLFCFFSEKCRTMCWCGVHHAEDKVELDGVDFGTAWENQPDQDIKSEINGSNLSNRMQDEAYINAAFVPERAGHVMSKQL
ncbi:sodium-coupled monocarboxylate transporter 2 isoform X2 [Ictalurus punctatus]|uniref:Sodium-coupled monocarboxylate transporter 2 isoform X2 n=1 Tax=Ictalurus punctatus TaxID=7998 RepID=A0A979F6T9_ICTPU|nr:sodium-coupled monocarboxylate transporter 2 isoform X2 [Ictalurus punctatus]